MIEGFIHIFNFFLISVNAKDSDFYILSCEPWKNGVLLTCYPRIYDNKSNLLYDAWDDPTTHLKKNTGIIIVNMNNLNQIFGIIIGFAVIIFVLLIMIFFLIRSLSKDYKSLTYPYKRWPRKEYASMDKKLKMKNLGKQTSSSRKYGSATFSVIFGEDKTKTGF